MKGISLDYLPIHLDRSEINRVLTGVPVLTLIVRDGKILAWDLSFDKGEQDA